MVVEGVSMAATNTLSTVNARGIRRRGGGGRQSGFQGQQQRDQDLVRLYSGSREQRERSRSTSEFVNTKDSFRWKKVNRTPKLKQCKLDVRREQWLCQPSPGQSHNQGFGLCAGTNQRTPTDSSAMKSLSEVNRSGSERKHAKNEVHRSEHVGSYPKCFESGELHVVDEQKQGLVNGWCSTERKSRSNSSCTSSSYTGSGSEDNEDTHDAEDDWEAAFDALHVQGALHKLEGHHKQSSSDRVQRNEGKDAHEKKPNGVHCLDLHSARLKPDYRYKNNGFGGRRGNGSRAWRPDDISRPPTLPRLAKQHTHPSQQSKQSTRGWGSIHGNMWDPPSSPSYCPICTEELDMTDSSYIPCNCGFQLCLFCYHRIASDDGRCPGCRKTYSSEGATSRKCWCLLQGRKLSCEGITDC
ncbi:unnamed protein product [Sphagnum jensenii]|uniref:RING-type domain-containing protein n=1 Tax=Sphagnum jensenii TaxID=128206 RepID=A0ABP0XK08_9BRYO